MFLIQYVKMTDSHAVQTEFSSWHQSCSRGDSDGIILRIPFNRISKMIFTSSSSQLKYTVLDIDHENGIDASQKRYGHKKTTDRHLYAMCRSFSTSIIQSANSFAGAAWLFHLLLSAQSSPLLSGFKRRSDYQDWHNPGSSGKGDRGLYPNGQLIVSLTPQNSRPCWPLPRCTSFLYL